jgi:hypothetical protein
MAQHIVDVGGLQRQYAAKQRALGVTSRLHHQQTISAAMSALKDRQF